MIAPLAPRILALPADIRAALARVDGPGWIVYAGNVTQRDPDPRIDVAVGTAAGMDRYMFPRRAFWPANPAASVAAVTGWPLWSVYDRFATVLDNKSQAGDDHSAALSIIEAHVANRSPS